MGNPFPFEVAQRSSFAKNGKVNGIAAGFALIMFLFTLLSWPLNAECYGSITACTRRSIAAIACRAGSCGRFVR